MNRRDDNFDQLQRLLALKRGERPPDDFFHGFPEQVRDHLHDPTPVRPLSWSERYGFDSPFRPVWLCGIGVFLCGLLAIGAISTRWVRNDQNKAQVLRNASSLPAGLTEDSLPDAKPVVETKSPLDPVTSSGTSSFEQWNLGTSTQNVNHTVPETRH